MLLFSGNKEKRNRAIVEKTILEHYNQYYRLAFSYVHNEMDAGDIVQNGAYKAIRSSHSLRQEEYVNTWVYRIMLNECFLVLKQSRAISYEEVLEEEGNEIGYMEDHYQDLDLQRAMEALSKEDRAVVVLKYFEDMKLEEIADILDENVNTVKSRLYRSLKKLRGMLSGRENPGEQNPGNSNLSNRNFSKEIGR